MVALVAFSITDFLSKHTSVHLERHRSSIIILGAGTLPLLVSFMLIRPDYIDMTVLLISLLAGFFWG